MPRVKKVQVWHFETFERRSLGESMTKLAAEGRTIFSVYPSMISGHFEVLSYEMKAPDGTGTI